MDEYTDREVELDLQLHNVMLKNEGLENQINNQKMELAWKSGEIAGLKYAIRHFAKGRKEKK